ncbi:MAG: hypothetical protein HUU54_04145 [Ignavibacteriaceae bacterium]|nr:hypothetical protein [Ignavibacteriaceae bacterium]
MKDTQDYLRDITEIRSMMERSSKFLSLSGWAGVLAGVYALAGAYIAYGIFNFIPDGSIYGSALQPGELTNLIILAFIVLALALGSAIFLSYRNAVKKGEVVWNPASRMLMTDMIVPLGSGGLLIIILLSHSLIGLIPATMLIFYGLSLFNASKYTFGEVRYLGLIQIVLGLAAAVYPEYSLILWALGFGAVHIIYGIFLHYRYQR